MIIRIILIINSVFIAQLIYSQTLHNYGIKAGLGLTGISSTDENIMSTDDQFFVNLLNFDFGLYSEFFNSKKFCVSAEFHYIGRGQDNPNYNKIVYIEQSNSEKIYKSKYLNDRFKYISVQILPRYRLVITSSGENMYVFGGPRFEFLTSSSNSGGYTNTVDLKNFGMDFGATFGLGVELISFLTLEFRIEHNFKGPYTFSFGSSKASYQHNSFTFLTGIALNRIFL